MITIRERDYVLMASDMIQYPKGQTLNLFAKKYDFYDRSDKDKKP